MSMALDAADAAHCFDLLATEPAWHRDALCREHPELTWFPSKGEAAARRAACAVCARCVVADDCRAWAMGFPGQLFGIFAGMSEGGRAIARRRRHRESRAA